MAENLEDTIAVAGDLILDVTAVHVDDRHRRSVGREGRAGCGPGCAQCFHARGQTKLHVTGDRAEGVRIGARNETHGLRRPQPLAA